jgi:ornithine cyclodeaminase
MRILRDSDLDGLDLRPLIAAVRAQIVADAMGETTAPPRHVVPFERGTLTFTIGGDRTLAGFRAYQTFAGRHGGEEHQVIAAWHQETGEMLGVALGNRLGALRTGVIGAVAAEILMPPDARVLTVVGLGRQAETQLLALAALRRWDEVRIYGRRREAVAEFCGRMATQIGGRVEGYTECQRALMGADAVVLATTAGQPVVKAEWIEPHAYVATLGPKQRDAHELPLEIAARARTIATDSPQQIKAMGDQHMLVGTESYDRIRHLGALVGDGPAPGPALFLSMGLAGTEVVCLAATLAQLESSS